MYNNVDKIDVMSLRPMYVTSQMTDGIKGVHVISPEECARGALNMMGKQTATNGHWKHRLQSFLVSCIPAGVTYAAEARRTRRLLEKKRAEGK